MTMWCVKHSALFAAALWASGCASKSYYASAEAAPSAGLGANQAELKDSSQELERSAPPTDAPKSAPAESTPAPQKPVPAKQRMVHYDGFAKLKVTSPEATLDAAVRIAEGVKGYVESRSGNVVHLRVPVASIREVFAQVLGLGDVLARKLSAQDITDAYLSAELRLKTLRASRDRLVDLLPSANENQKISLLREIQRLSEQVVALEVQVRTLQQLAVFSRITVEVVPRQPANTSPVDELQAFRWIHALSPFGRSVAGEHDELELEPPANMVVTATDDDYWVAESADGAQIWASKLENEPRGDTVFWANALKTRLAKEYATVEETRIGKFQFVRIVDETYRYLVGVSADDDDLQLIEIYYPTPEHEKRHGAAIQATVERGES